MIKQLHHVGVVVRNLDDTMALYSKMLGLEPVSRHEIAEAKLKIANYGIGKGSQVEFIEAAPGSPLSEFLENNGEGLHHIAFEVDDINAELKILAGMGVDLVDREARPGPEGKIAFVGPQATHGVVIELVQCDA